MGQEFELKFAADAARQARIRAAYPGWKTTEMETTYYDTPSRSLSTRHITLRRRMENGVSVCTVKTPLDGSARGEWECPCDSIDAFIVELCKLGAPETVAALASEGLQTVCGARFTRQSCTVQWQGAALELALDSGILLGGGKEVPLCEVEVELKSGSRAAAIAFASALSAAYCLAPETKSKFRRALAQAEGE